MKVVVDANEIFSAAITKGRKKSSWCIELLFSDDLEFYAPERLLHEFSRNIEDIKMKSGFSHAELDLFITLLKLRIKFINLNEFQDHIEEALKITPHEKDAEYFALALKPSSPILSEEKSFKEQEKVRIYNSQELFKETRRN
jgi:predicted nucleic acid-binding protein